MATEHPSVVAIQESLENDRIPGRFEWPDDYCVIKKPTRYSANGRPLGGSVLLIRAESMLREIETNGPFDAVAARVKIGKRQVTVCSLYWEQGGSVTEEDIIAFLESLPRPYIVMADANARSTSWGSRETCGRGTILEGAMMSSTSVILNDGSHTRLSPQTGHTTCPDVTLVSHSLALDVDWYVWEDNFGSDHYPIVMPLLGRGWTDARGRDGTEGREGGYDWERADWVEYHAMTGEESGLRGIERMSQLVEFVAECTNQTVPKRSFRTGYETPIPWWSRELHTLRNKSRSAARRFRRNNSQENGLLYRRTRAIFRRSVKEAIREHWRSVVEDLNFRTDLSETWDKLRRIQGKSKPRIKKIVLDHSGELVDDPERVAEILARKFAEVSTTEPPQITVEEQIEEDGAHNAPFSYRELETAMNEMNKDSAPGPDGIFYRQVKEANVSLLNKLLDLYNEIWRTGRQPDDWKISVITPVLKPGRDATDPGSYRPIALTSMLARIMERMVLNRLDWIVERRTCNKQYGFRRHLNAEDVIAEISKQAQTAKILCQHTLALCLDLKGAYDYTPKQLFLNRLTSFGIGGRLWKFIDSTTTDRKTQVKVQDKKSSYMELKRGLQQGSILSPTLFRLALDRLFECESPEVKILAYADDLTLITRSNDSYTANGRLQKTLEVVERWMGTNGFELSADKTKLIHFRDLRSRGGAFVYMKGKGFRCTRVDESNHANILGVVFDEGLTFAEHARRLGVRINTRFNLMKSLLGNFFGASQDVLRRIYVATILPILDYGSIAFNSAPQTTLRQLDTIQNNAMRLISGALKSTPISAMQHELALLPLQTRRNRIIMSKMIKDKALGNLIPTFRGDIEQIEQKMNRLRHPLKPWHQVSRQFSNETRYNFLRCPVAPLTPSDHSPWTRKPPNVDLELSGMPKEQTIAVAYRKEFDRIVGTRYQDRRIIYTDGSRTVNSGNGANMSPITVGFAAVCPNVATRSGRLPPQSSIASAELRAIQAALEIALETTDDILIASDSLSMLLKIQNTQYTTDLALDNLLNTLDSIQDNNRAVTLIWIPSHVGIAGNEMADNLAKTTAPEITNQDQPVRSNDLKNEMKRITMNESLAQWSCIEWTGNAKPSMSRQGYFEGWRRKDQVIMSRLRMRRTNITHAYKLSPDGSWAPPQTQCDCGSVRTVEHMLFDCPTTDTARRKWKVSPQQLRSSEGEARKLIEFLKETSLYSQI